MNEELTDRQRKYIDGVARGLNSRDAARAAGYAESFGKVIRTRLKQNHIVARLVSEIRAEARKQSSYDLTTAMEEAEAVCVFAQKHKNAMAYCKAVELRSKLSGLLVDKVEVVHADLRGALEAAERRIINVKPAADVTNGTVAPTAKRAVSWLPKIAGDTGAEDHEPTPADGQLKNQGAK